jgi:hypothetical protein
VVAGALSSCRCRSSHQQHDRSRSMNITDIFIRRRCWPPCSVCCWCFSGCGLMAASACAGIRNNLPGDQRDYGLPGTNAELMQGFITRPLKHSPPPRVSIISNRTTRTGYLIFPHLQAGYSVDAAFADISAGATRHNNCRAMPKIDRAEKARIFQHVVLSPVSRARSCRQQITDYIIVGAARFEYGERGWQCRDPRAARFCDAHLARSRAPRSL